MILPLVVALLPVLVGLVLAFVPAFRSRGAGPARTFALAAATAVVLLELLPAGASALGALGLLLFGAALLLPAILERVVRRLGRGRALGAPLGLLGLLLHQVVDGIEIGAAWQLEAGLGVALGVSAHSIPLVAVVIEPFVQAGQRRQALLFGFGLLVATAMGIVLGQHGLHGVPGAESWMPAVVGGLLLHVLWHGALEGPAPHGRQRLSELIGLAAGVGLPLWLLDHGGASRYPAASRIGFEEALLELTLEAAPALLLGVVLGALARAAPLPPIATLRRRGAGAALGVALLLVVPDLRVETFALSLRFLGLPFALLRLLGVVLSAVVAAVVLTRLTPERHPGPPDPGRGPARSFARRVLDGIDQVVLELGPWVAVGLVLAAAVEAFVTPAQVSALQGTGLEIPVLSLLMAPLFFGAASITPLVGVLWAKGLSAGAALACLLVGPALNPTALGVLGRVHGLRPTALAIGAYILCAWGVAVLLQRLLPGTPPLLLEEATGHRHGPLTALAGGALVVLAGRSMWRVGPRAWAAALSDLHPHAHAPGPGSREQGPPRSPER